jgi:hypothetical protein
LSFVGTYDFTDATVIDIGGAGNLALTCVVPLVCTPNTIVRTGNVSILPFVGDTAQAERLDPSQRRHRGRRDIATLPPSLAWGSPAHPSDVATTVAS